jgi:sugar fermentation stimulation protein A
MNYNKVVKAKFVERPNRFIAFCDIDGKIEKVHVKNTGRCKELLTDEAVVYLEESDNPNRKTKYSLIAVEKGNRLINMDSQVPNKVVYEGLVNKKIVLPGIDEEITFIKPEKTYNNSRFDIYLETKSKKVFIEVKGVTLEEDNIVKFPDAKTERGVKHINELIEAKKDGYECYILFLIQMNNVLYFTPNNEMHKDLGDALINARNNGVGVLAYDSLVEFNSITINKEIKVIL